MMDLGKHIMVRFKKRWQLMEIFSIFLFALGPAFLIYILKSNSQLAALVFLGVAAVLVLIKKPWRLTLKKLSSYIDQKFVGVEYSTGLLLLPKEELSNMAVLQRYKISDILKENIDTIKPAVDIKKALVTLLVFTLLSLISYQFSLNDFFEKSTRNNEPQELVKFRSLDSTSIDALHPSITSQKLTIYYPAYTKLKKTVTSNMNIRSLEGAKLAWEVQFDTLIQGAYMEIIQNEYPMAKLGNGYSKQMFLTESGFYNFKFKDVNDTSYSSDLYAMEVIKDESPLIEIKGLKQFTSFDFSQRKVINLKAELSDDYGIGDSYIIATVTKGEGESVKFREERLTFDDKLASGSKQLVLSKKIDLDQLKMEPGDELYFYIVAIDTKRPKENISRSETYFAVIKDTLTNQFAVAGTMGADLMPDYFRSQRQLIIDTEKLIADKNRITKEKFNFTSNELGFDQKALRLKYGEFMGDEDVGIGPATEEVKGVQTESDADVLKAYTHDHDGNNEHNLVDHDDSDETDKKQADPLESYLHNHDDPEESTLFTASLKSMLRQAMAEMWDAELFLRLYTPEKSLPFQYRALKLIQEIKNSARIYVHRIGFDPPPIKEDKRLSGAIEEVDNYRKVEDIDQPEEFPFIKIAIERLERLINSGFKISLEDRSLFVKAGNELAVLAIQEPGKHLNTLQQLKWISEQSEASSLQLKEVQKGLLAAVPVLKPEPKSIKAYHNDINTLLLKELELNE